MPQVADSTLYPEFWHTQSLLSKQSLNKGRKTLHASRKKWSTCHKTTTVMPTKAPIKHHLSDFFKNRTKLIHSCDSTKMCSAFMHPAPQRPAFCCKSRPRCQSQSQASHRDPWGQASHRLQGRDPAVSCWFLDFLPVRQLQDQIHLLLMSFTCEG